MIELLNIDCIEYMKTVPDKFFDLAIVDPPYGLGDKISKGGGAHTKATVKFHHRYNANGTNWDKAPDASFFVELKRVSKNQIIWGGNYFDLGKCRGFIIWDKPEMRIPTMSDCEFAWTSFYRPAKIVKISRGNGAQNKFHPTGKPVKLYKWLFKNYAKEGDKILDTHLGSGSIAVAAHEMDFDLTGCEIDVSYYNDAVKWYNNAIMQQSLF